MRFKINSLRDLDLKGKNVFMRVDFNVPIKNGKITDPHRIDSVWPSISYILEEGGRLILASHLGRPKRREEKFSLKPIAGYLSEKYGLEVLFVEEADSEAPLILLSGLKSNQLILLENLRFHEGEKGRDPHFAKKLSSFCDVYVNEGFGISHRDHTSVTLLPEMVPHRGVGFLFEKEIQELNHISLNPVKPFFVILGGSKVSDKISVLGSLIDKADEFFIGGMIAYTFLKAKGFSMGNSYVDQDMLNTVTEFITRLEERGKKLWLPLDHKIVENLKKPYKVTVTEDENILKNHQALDIGPKTQALFAKEILRSRSLFWNGPMGFFEEKEFEGGTRALAESLASHSEAYRVVGGGHSAVAVRPFEKDINHISTGGGASLYYLKEKDLPGIESLKVRVIR